MKKIFCKFLFSICLLLLTDTVLKAAKIGEIETTDLKSQIFRFFTFQDPSLRYALLGSLLLGTSCGLLGSFIVVRRFALMGDTLSHAVLPGVALGFLWKMNKDPLAIFVGATLAGLIGTWVVGWITHTTKIKQDAALGIVLASFFAFGICLLTMIQRLPAGNKSGIDKFLFGQAAAISSEEVVLMAIVTIVTILVLSIFYKEFLISSFDLSFAHALGLPIQWLQHGLMLLLAFSIVVSLQAVGVVLVSAMLITPAASAYLLTDRMHRMLLLATVFGMLAGGLGAFFSFLGNNLPTGPFMVLAATSIFVVAFLFGPRHGIVSRWWRQRSQKERIQRENTLKSIYHVLEAASFKEEGVPLRELAEQRRETLEEVLGQTTELARHHFVTFNNIRDAIYLTPQGWQRAGEIVRNHRLWELYLTNAAQFEVDHVHEEAEKIEHVLGEEIVRQLEKRLNYAKVDPHGRRIPSIHDIQGEITSSATKPSL